MILEYIILFSLGSLLLGMSFSYHNICPWISDLLSNLATGLYCSIVLYYIIERAQDKMKKERELPLKKSILFNIAKHLEVILTIYAGRDLSDFFIEEDAQRQFRKEVIGLRQASNIIGFVTLPPDFLDKFFDLVEEIETPDKFILELPEYLIYEQELSIALKIKELFEMMFNLESVLPRIMFRNTINLAEDTIERLEYNAEYSRKMDSA